MFLNVIIPSYRAGATIPLTIESIRKGRDFPGRFDITVVDSSDDGTAELVRTQFPDLNLIKLGERAYPGAARNKGVEATKGDILCFIDADAYAAPDWLTAIHAYFEKNPDVAAVGGPVLNANPSGGWSRLAHWCEFSGYGPHAPEGPRRVQPTVNLAIRRDAFLKNGPFLEDQFGNEDVLLLYRMRKAGEKLHFIRSVQVYHRNKTSLAEIYTHQYRLGECTGRARVLYDLPGSFLTRPGGSYLVPYVKSAFIKWRIIIQEPGEIGSFLINWPWVFKTMCHFARGFRHGVRHARD